MLINFIVYELSLILTSLSLYVADKRNTELTCIPVSIINVMVLHPPTPIPLKVLLNCMCLLPEHATAQISHLENTW